MRQANPIKSRLPAIFTDLLLVSLLPLWHNRISGTFIVDSDTHYSTNNKVTFFVEWVNAPKNGVRSHQGRAVGTGAYIYKAELKCKFLPNANLDEKTKKRFETSNSYDKTETFGIRRLK